MNHASRSFALAAVAVMACTTTTGPIDPSTPALSFEQPLPTAGRSSLRAGAILFYDDPIVVEVPPSVIAGTPFTVTVTTYGGGCIAEDITVVRVDGQRADVVPYQRVSNPGPNGACTEELRVTKREASVTFASKGTAVVRVIGRVKPADTLTQVERTVVVR